MIDPYFSVPEAVLQAEFDVLARRLAFLLCQTQHDGKRHFTLSLYGIDVLFFKENWDVLVQFPDIVPTIQGISVKPTEGLGNDHINVSVHTVSDNAVKFLPLFRVRSGDPVNDINPSRLSFRILLDSLRLMRPCP